MTDPARVLPPRALARPAPRQSSPEQASSLTYLECTVCGRRSMFLRVDINTGVCTRCKQIATPRPQPGGAA